MLNKKIQWGIIATGGIANKFADQFKRVKNAEILGVGSRKLSTARNFAAKHRLPRFYASYQELVNDPDIDAIYVATPHILHCENTLMALKAGKAVLCEKPFSINQKEAGKMISLARKKQLFLMEGMWCRFNPCLKILSSLLARGTIGEVCNLKADFSFICPYLPKKRWLNIKLGGGALLDVGVYPVSLASMIFGPPERIKSSVFMGKTGVDMQNSILFEYSKGQEAQLTSAFNYNGDQRAIIAGTKGTIILHKAWHRALKISIRFPDNKENIIRMNKNDSGLNLQIDHVNQCLRKGRKESPIMSLDESVRIMKTMDMIRKQWGFKYPSE